jgi:hypothetical protein
LCNAFQTPRRTRPFCPASWKAAEYLLFAIALFPVLLDVLAADTNRSRDAMTWQYFAYIMRSVVMSAAELTKLSEERMRVVQLKFYKCFESTYGKEQLPYNIHTVWLAIMVILLLQFSLYFFLSSLQFASHVDRLVASSQDVLHDSSFPFEASFAKMRLSYKTGTRTITKQILHNMLLKKHFGAAKHVCRKSFRFGIRQTKKMRDDLLFRFSGSSYEFYKLVGMDGDVFKVRVVHSHANVELIPELAETGVLEYSHTANSVVKKSAGWFHGKAIIVNGNIVAMPSAVLTEV